MSTADERTRALVWAGGFLIELARDDSISVTLRRQAVIIARHFPTIEDVLPAGVFYDDSSATSISEISTWIEGCRYGPLRDSTRLPWPNR